MQPCAPLVSVDKAAVRAFQNAHRLRGHSIANMETQRVLQEEVELKRDRDPDTWTVVDED